MAEQEMGAVARKDGRWWLVEVPSLDSAGQAARLDDVEKAAQEIIELMVDLKPGSYQLRVDYVMPENMKVVWEGSKLRERKAREEQAVAARLARQTVQGLLEQGYNQKETAKLLGLSHQRVNQLAHSA